MTKQTTVVSFCGNMVADGLHHRLCAPRSRGAKTGVLLLMLRILEMLVHRLIQSSNGARPVPYTMFAMIVANVLYAKVLRPIKLLRLTRILYLSRGYCCSHLKHRIPAPPHCLGSLAGIFFSTYFSSLSKNAGRSQRISFSKTLRGLLPSRKHMKMVQYSSYIQLCTGVLCGTDGCRVRLYAK